MGRGRTEVGLRKVPVPEGWETAEGRPAGWGAAAVSTAAGPSAGLPKRRTLPGPTSSDATRCPSE
ncbi:hypothetical protein GCM10020000_72790 [Streptomyces olivoverticillatus]